MSDHSHSVTEVVAGIGLLFVVLLFAALISVDCKVGSLEDRLDAIEPRFDAIEFYLDCQPEHRYVNADGESFCLEETP